MKVQFNSKRQANPESDSGISVPYYATRKKVALLRWLVILLVVSLPLVYLGGHIFLSVVRVEASGTLVMDKVQVNAPDNGVIQDVYVESDQWVEAGQPLITLRDDTLSERLDVLESERQSLKEAMNSERFITMPDAQRLAALERSIELAREMVGYWETNLVNIRQLYDQGAATAAELHNAVTQLNQARLTLAQAQGALGALYAAKSTGEDPGMFVRFERVKAEIGAVRSALDRLSLHAPIEGTVLEVAVAQGESVPTGQRLLVIGQPDKLRLTAYISAENLRYAVKGQRCRVFLSRTESIMATVDSVKTFTVREPEEFVDPLERKMRTAVATLEPDQPIPDRYAIEGLPVRVHFNMLWYPWR